MKNIIFSILFLVAIQPQAQASYPIWKNIHTVKEGVLYRSATLKPDALESLLKEKKIKTIINLRGPNEGHDWYELERAVAEDNNVALIDIPMSAKLIPTRKNLLKLIESYDSAEYPILIHCQAGADRTGEAAAMFLMDHYGVPKEEALKQLTLKYYHSSWSKPAKRYFIKEIYHGPQWALENYKPCEENWKYFDYSHCQPE